MRYVIHNHLRRRATDLSYYSGDVIWIDAEDEAAFDKIKVNSKIETRGKTAVVVDKKVIKSQFSGTLYRIKVRFL